MAVRVLFAGGYRSADMVEALVEQCAQARQVQPEPQPEPDDEEAAAGPTEET